MAAAEQSQRRPVIYSSRASRVTVTVSPGCLPSRSRMSFRTPRMGVRKEIRERLGKQPGDTVTVTLEALDE